MQTILVTGGAGYIGSHTVLQLSYTLLALKPLVSQLKSRLCTITITCMAPWYYANQWLSTMSKA